MDWWRQPTSEVLEQLGTGAQGLTSTEAAARLAKHGRNEVTSVDRVGPLRLLWGQVSSPLVLILVFAAVVSALAREWTDAVVVLIIVTASSLIGFWREYAATRVVDALRSRIAAKVKVLRDGREVQVPAADLVPGDVLTLSAGSLVAADALVLEARDFFVSQAALTGETFPVEKKPGPLADAKVLVERNNSVFLGTNVRSGTARAVVVETGRATQFGQLAGRLRERVPETEFDRGLRHFGGLLTRVMVVMTLVVLALNLLAHRPGIESLLFAIALAVGLAPELLPAILAVNLARSASEMAKAGVLVRRLNAIENFGSMTVLCTDKTGTLTEGVMRLEGAVDAAGAPSRRVLELAFANAALQTGISNPLDEALLAAGKQENLVAPPKLDEVPYDFTRRRLSVVVGEASAPLLVTKGAVAQVLEVCAGLDDEAMRAADAFVDAKGREGLRVLAVASRRVTPQPSWSRADEQALTLEGYLLFADPPKAGVVETVAALRKLGVRLKVITGDNVHVAQHLAERVGLPATPVLTGAELMELRGDALAHRARETDLFAEVDPQQKERLVLALRQRDVVGYMGDGINDAPALHAADVGISVESAVDVAREAADFVLLAPRLEMLRDAIVAGRRTFANTLKYVMTTTSANLGNMLSMAAASVVLPFFPLTAGQILLNNFLSDVPAIGLATDAVDDEWLATPHRWDTRDIRRFMFRFGAVSSLFDFVTFGVLLGLFHAEAATFQTGWFIESLLTELAVALVLRTRRAAWKSRPGRLLLWSSVGVAAVALAVPWIPGAGVLGFVPLPPLLVVTIIGITAAYVLTTEWLKRRAFPGAGAEADQRAVS
ncbi:MAG: magnesium-translocating P-type ATPase [Myxococcota bacterium]